MCAFLDPHSDALAHWASVQGLPAAIPELLTALLAGIRQALGNNLVGIYLRGSLATGDFDPLTSDVDFLVVTEHDPDELEVARLLTLHDHLAALPNRFALELEGTYLSRAALRRFRPGECFLTLARHESLIWREHGTNWLLERWMLREQGLVLLGPSPATLIDPLDVEDLRAAVRQQLPDWRDWAAHPDDPDWQSARGHKAYAVETMCRALCTLATGTLLSKPRAVAWVLTTLPEPWRGTVARSRQWHADQTMDTSINPEVMRFITWAAEQGS